MADHPLLVRIGERLDDLTAGAAKSGEGTGLLIGLSGGPDSVVLLRAAHRWARNRGRDLAAAHLHHGLRGAWADADLEFCRELCAKLDVPLHEEQADVRPEARKRGMGLEEAGRHLRRRFFRRLLDAQPVFGFVATGHHRDDQAETILMRFFRGTGPDGLRGMRPADGPFLHPMLAVERSEIVACLEDIGQPWRTDATNVDGDNLRAKIRRELWPVIKGIFGSGAEKTPARLADLLEQDLDLLERLAHEALNRTRAADNPQALDITVLKELDPALRSRVLRNWIGEMKPGGLERVHVEGIMTWLDEGTSGSSLDLPGGLTVTRSFDRLHVEKGNMAAVPLRLAADYRILVNRNEDADPTGVGDPADESTWHLMCPAEALRGNLNVRNLREGDRFQPFGLEGHKKLSDLLREKRVPAADRPEVLIVTDDDGILWVVGLARAERTRILPTTGRRVTISVAPRADHQQPES